MIMCHCVCVCVCTYTQTYYILMLHMKQHLGFSCFTDIAAFDISSDARPDAVVVGRHTFTDDAVDGRVSGA
jgi:hypothetical protein